MSVLLTDVAGARRALEMSAFLESFYKRLPVYRGVVLDVLTRLRKHKAINVHGVGEAVGQSIKTASLAFLCAGLTNCHPLDGLDTADKVLAALAAFDAAAFFFEVKGGRNRGSDEAESGVTLLSTPDNASSMNGLGLADGSLRVYRHRLGFAALASCVTAPCVEG